MYEIISPILEWINLHPQLAGLATFVISAAESIAIIGTIIPGTIMMSAIGALAGAGVMPLWSTLVWAILGAVVGDGISYWIGYKFKDRLHYIWPFRSHPYLLASGEKFFRKHGGKSVFIGRFVGPVRALVPLVAGMLNMKPWRFTIANIASAIGWAPAYMLPGIALGAASLELPPDLAVHAILMLLLVGLFIIFCLWLIQRIFSLINTQINHVLTVFWNKLSKSRYFSLITIALKHHNPTKTYGQLILAFYFLLSSSLFLYLASYIYLYGSDDLFVNNSFLHLFRSIRTPTGENIMLMITFLGESRILLPVLGVLFIWLAWTKRWYSAWHVLALGIFTFVGIEGFKHLVHSARPWGIAHSPHGSSFPSGHTTIATAYYFGIALLLTKAFRYRFRRFFYTLASIIILAVATSRLYLGAHWFTDILGGVLLGASILMLIMLSYNRKAEKKVKPSGVILVILLSFIASYSFYAMRNFETLKNEYMQIDSPIYAMSIDSWWKQQGDHLPLYRLNRFGLSTQVLNLQWLGNLSEIKTVLLKNGWQTPPVRNWVSVMQRISDVQSAEHLPIVSPLYLDKEPVLILTRQASGNKKLIVLRLWESNITINNVKQPLWVGAVEVVPRTFSWLFKPKRSNAITLTPELLFKAPTMQYTMKELTVKNTRRGHTEQQPMILIKPKGI